MIWHNHRMPDDQPLHLPRPDPERVHLGRMQADLEFLIEQISRLPTRQEQALRPLYVMVETAGFVILFQLFWRHCF
jgi:hypothetical protein